MRIKKFLLSLALTAFLFTSCSAVHEGLIQEKAGIKQSAIEQPWEVSASKIKILWEWEHWRDSINIDRWAYYNVCTDEGLNHVLDVQFHGEAASATWYVLIFKDDVTPTTATTYAVPVFTEANAGYNEANRPTWTEAAASSKSITNSANKAVFSMLATLDIYGAALVDDNTKGDTVAAGAVMFCAAKFGSSKSVENGDTLKVVVTITLADS